MKRALKDDDDHALEIHLPIDTLARLTLLDLTLPTPEENLALDEALLIVCEEAVQSQWPAEAAEVLRFWESSAYFVALGVGQKLKADVDLEACIRSGVPVLRRASGGGTVLQGPGCLNFTLVVSLEARPELRDLQRSYKDILERTARGLGLERVSPRGVSDLTLGDQKFCGNAQKRTRRALLHHGTILHEFDLQLVGQFLREPAKQPEYRERRAHQAFLTNISLRAEEIKSRIAGAWTAAAPATPFQLPPLERLLREKYATREWTERF